MFLTFNVGKGIRNNMLRVSFTHHGDFIFSHTSRTGLIKFVFCFFSFLAFRKSKKIDHPGSLYALCLAGSGEENRPNELGHVNGLLIAIFIILLWWKWCGLCINDVWNGAAAWPLGAGTTIWGQFEAQLHFRRPNDFNRPMKKLAGQSIFSRPNEKTTAKNVQTQFSTRKNYIL